MSGTVKEAHLSMPDRLLRAFSYGLVKLVQRPKLHGEKPVLDKPSIFVCRHVGLMDPVILMVEYYSMMLHPLAAQDYYDKNTFMKGFFTHAQCIPIDRKNHSDQWLKDASAALSKGESIIIFPEGTRNKEGRGLMRFHTGAVRLAAETGAQLIPVYNAIWDFPHRYNLAIGRPYHLDPVPEGGYDIDWLHQQARKMQDKVAELEIKD